MLEDADHFLTSILVHDAFAVRDLEIPIARDGERRHLLLTGPNGSGKSSILTGLHASLMAYPRSFIETRRRAQDFLADLDHAGPSGAVAPLSYAGDRAYEDVINDDVRWALEQRDTAAVEPRFGGAFEGDRMLLAFMEATRKLTLLRPKGPERLDEERFLRSSGAAAMLLQFLVNLRTSQAYAREDGDDAQADQIRRRLDLFEERLGEIFDDRRVHLHFDRSYFNFKIELGDGRRVDFEHLPDGISSILYMWASLMIPAEAILRSGVSDPPGWALIDEPELHLHARLQEMVLPFLTTMFPRVQLIVATHSPAVLASIPDATIYDLGSRQAIESDDLRGIRYGTILTGHFGIETDFDLATTRKLRRLEALSRADPAPGTAEFEEMRRIAHELSGLPHLLVAQVSKKLDVA